MHLTTPTNVWYSGELPRVVDGDENGNGSRLEEIQFDEESIGNDQTRCDSQCLAAAD